MGGRCVNCRIGGLFDNDLLHRVICAISLHLEHGNKLARNLWNYFIQVTCIELEKLRLPVLLVKYSIKKTLLECISYGVLNNREGKEFLNTTVNSK